MFGRKHPQVLVVGAGPVGLFTALVLARRGVHVQIVDEEGQTTSHSYALALHPRSLQLLEEAGLLAPVLDRAYRVRTVGLYDGATRRAGMRLADLTEDFSFLAVLRQDVLEGLLEEALAAEGVKVQWNHQVTTLLPEADHVLATIDRIDKESMGYSIAHMEWIVSKSRNLAVPYVVGADGHRSFVRRAAQLPFAEVGPAQHYAVFEFATDADLEHEMRLAIGPDTLDVLWPLPDGRCRWSFELKDTLASDASREKARLALDLGTTRFPVLDEAYLHALIEERAPWFTGSVDEVEWRILVRFERRLAEAFGRERMWLAGDAAHMTGPAGIQSMNVGLREAKDLADALADIVLDGASEDRLATYDRTYQTEWRFLLGQQGHIAPTASTDPWITEHAGRILPCLPASGPDLERLMAQLNLRMRSVLAPA